MEQDRIGVAFSSGFFGFFAHAGFLAALREVGVAPVAYAGSSSGAIVAAMAACGMDDRAIKDMLFRVRKEQFWDPDPWYSFLRKAVRLLRGYGGYLRGDRFADLLKSLPVSRIEDCKTQLAISGTNLTQKKETIFTRGDLVKAICASSAMPLLFKPVEIDGSLFVDGGVVNKAPVKALADMVELDSIIVHFIASENVEEAGNEFLKRSMTPWHIQYTAVNIARQEAYQMQLELLRMRGIKVLEVKSGSPAVGPNRLKRGPEAYINAKGTGAAILTKLLPAYSNRAS